MCDVGLPIVLEVQSATLKDKVTKAGVTAAAGTDARLVLCRLALTVWAMVQSAILNGK